MLLSGITPPPAYAGKSKIRRKGRWQHRDHPRVCGEKTQIGQVVHPDWGSPPRMRGKEVGVSGDGLQLGITPAYAGKSPTAKQRGILRRDHPRVCGEKRSCPVRGHHRMGSPPRMRGKAEGKAEIARTLRITPAYAGKRLKRSRSTVPPVAIVPLFPSVCNKPVVSDGSPAGRDAPLFLPAENAVPASPAYNLRSL